MCKIRFRGKRISDGKWVYGFPWDDDGDGNPDVIVNPQAQGAYPVNPITVSQFIGLCTSSNQKIYEGDIIRYQNMTWLVEPISSLEKDGRNWGLCVSLNGSGNCYFIDSSILKGKVIGNIIDNPELLGGGYHVRNKVQGMGWQ